jgi:hypothetical protein
MSSEIEKQLLEKIAKLEKLLNQQRETTFSFSNITFDNLRSLVKIKKVFNSEIFNFWFNSEIEISDKTIDFFENLIKENIYFIQDYNEEDLKVNLIIPILQLVKFKDLKNEFRDFYELPLKYQTEKFIFKGTSDFVVAKGLFQAEIPYFFIQEFKKGKENSDPEPQLLAELITGLEISNFSQIKGAFIVGAIWNFVILEKIEKDSYRYFVSENLYSTKIEDLKQIYKNLLFIKNEIIAIFR